MQRLTAKHEGCDGCPVPAFADAGDHRSTMGRIMACVKNYRPCGGRQSCPVAGATDFTPVIRSAGGSRGPRRSGPGRRLCRAFPWPASGTSTWSLNPTGHRPPGEWSAPPDPRGRRPVPQRCRGRARLAVSRSRLSGTRNVRRFWWTKHLYQYQVSYLQNCELRVVGETLTGFQRAQTPIPQPDSGADPTVDPRHRSVRESTHLEISARNSDTLLNKGIG